MIKTIQELKDQAMKIDLHEFTIRRCSMCGYPLKYLISPDFDYVFFDEGCDCRFTGPIRSNWRFLADAYNRNQPENNPSVSEEYLKELNDIWKFEDTKNEDKPSIEEDKSLTFGQKMVGLNFNPGGDETVTKIKKLYAEIIDIMKDVESPIYVEDKSMSEEKIRLVYKAIIEAQGAQMWAVKAITWKY